MEVTSQPLLTAALHIREPRKPLPPQTTSRLAAVIVLGSELGLCGEWLIHVMRLMEWTMRYRSQNVGRRQL